MFKKYFKAAIIISIRNYDDTMKVWEKLGPFISNEEYIQKLSEKIEFNALKDHVDKAISTLDSREAKVIRLSLGLEDGKEKKLEEIAKELGDTVEMVKRIEFRAFITLLMSEYKEVRTFMSAYNTKK